MIRIFERHPLPPIVMLGRAACYHFRLGGGTLLAVSSLGCARTGARRTHASQRRQCALTSSRSHCWCVQVQAVLQGRSLPTTLKTLMWPAAGANSRQPTTNAPGPSRVAWHMLHLWNELRLLQCKRKFFMVQFFKPMSYTNLNQINHSAPLGRNPNVQETMFRANSGTLTKIVFLPIRSPKNEPPGFFMPAGPSGPLSAAPSRLPCGPYVVRVPGAGRLALMFA